MTGQREISRGQASARLKIRHSPSNATQPKRADVSRDLPFGQGLGENVGGHVICGAVDEGEGVVSDDLPDEVVTDVDVFGLCMEVVFSGKLNCSLVVAEESGRGRGYGEQLENEASEPDGLLGHVCCGDVFSLGGG